jgi:hypothetical protein
VKPWFPGASADVVKVTTPPISDTVPRAVFPSMKVTLPVGKPLPAGVTVAESVTSWPEYAGLGEPVSAVEVVCRIPRLTPDEVLPRKFASPAYVTVMECEPALSEEIVSVACPPLKVPVPRLAGPSMNVAVPVGVPAAGATEMTVADNVTGWPTTPGLGKTLTEALVEPWLTVCVREEDVLVAKLLSPE